MTQYKTRTQWWDAGFQVPQFASPTADFVDPGNGGKIPGYSREQVVDLRHGFHDVVVRPTHDDDEASEIVPGI